FGVLNGICSGSMKRDGETFTFRGRRHAYYEAEEMLATVQAEVEKDRSRLAQFDRAVFMLNYHLASRLGHGADFERRYRCHLELQRFGLALWQHQAHVESVWMYLNSQKQFAWEDLFAVKESLRLARDQLGELLERAQTIVLPSLTHVESGEPLGRFLPEKLVVADLDEVTVTLHLGWVEALHRQMALVMAKVERLQMKSLNGILTFQERL